MHSKTASIYAFGVLETQQKLGAGDACQSSIATPSVFCFFLFFGFLSFDSEPTVVVASSGATNAFCRSTCLASRLAACCVQNKVSDGVSEIVLIVRGAYSGFSLILCFLLGFGLALLRLEKVLSAFKLKIDL